MLFYFHFVFVSLSSSIGGLVDLVIPAAKRKVMEALVRRGQGPGLEEYVLNRVKEAAAARGVCGKRVKELKEKTEEGKEANETGKGTELVIRNPVMTSMDANEVEVEMTWKAIIDDSTGYVCYLNTTTGESRWDDPNGAIAPPPLPQGKEGNPMHKMVIRNPVLMVDMNPMASKYSI